MSAMRRFGALPLGLLALALVLLAAGPARAAEEESVFPPEADAPSAFMVPPGVYYLTIRARGAGGEQGDSDTGRPGRGAIVEGTFQVTPGEVLPVYTATGDGWGYAEGGDRGEVGGSSSDGQGGGGASSVLAEGSLRPFLIAGGGGGAGGDDEADGGAGGDAGAPKAYAGAPGNYGHDPVPEKVAGGCGGCQLSGEGGKGDGDRLNPFSGGGGGGGGGGFEGGAGGQDGTIGFENLNASGAGGGGGSSFINPGALDPRFSIYSGCEEREGPDCEGLVVFSWGGAPTQVTAAEGGGQRVTVTQAFSRLRARVTDAAGVPVTGTKVVFSVPTGGGPSGILPGGRGEVEVTTDDEGFANLNGMLANGVTGDWTLEAKAAGVSRPALFALTNAPIATRTAVVSSLDPATTLEAPELTATVTGTIAERSLPPVGEVSFEVDGAPIAPAVPLTASGVARLAAGRLPFLAAGNHPVVATYLGDAAHSRSEAALTQTVEREPTAVELEAEPNPSASGEAVVLRAQIATRTTPAAAPTGTVEFSSGGTKLGSAELVGTGTATILTEALAAGSDELEASYGGDQSFGPATGRATAVVDAAGTATVLRSSANPSTFGAGATVEAVVRRHDPGPAPTGTVAFSLDGEAICGGPLTLANGSASCQLPATTAAGARLVTAAYTPAPGSPDKASSGTLRQLVVGAPTTTAVAVAPEPSLLGQRTTLGASVAVVGGGSADGAVQFVLDGVALGSPVPLAAGRATLAAPCDSPPLGLSCPLGPGAHLAEAIFVPASADLRTSRAVAFAHVDPDPTAIRFDAVANPVATGQPLSFATTVTAGSGQPPRGEVQFLLDGTSLGEPVPVVRGGASSPAVSLSPGNHQLLAHFIAGGRFDPSEATLDVDAAAPPATAAATAPIPRPRLELLTRQARVDAHGRFSVQLACAGPPASSCGGPARFALPLGLELRRPPKLAAGTVLGEAEPQIAAGDTATLRVSLNRDGRRQISSRRTLRTALQLGVDGGEPQLSLRATVATPLVATAASRQGDGLAIALRCGADGVRRGEACRGKLQLAIGGHRVGDRQVEVGHGRSRSVVFELPPRALDKRRVTVRAVSLIAVGRARVATRTFEVAR